MNKKESNRYKIMFINHRQMMKLITGECVIKNIPEFTKIIDFRENWMNKRGFEILIEHPSFPEVPEGVMIPEIYDLIIEETGKRNGRKLYFD